MTLLLVAYSDQRGRKMTISMPLIGSLIYTCSFLVVSFFELNVYLLIAANFASALFGGIGTMLGGCFTYVADLCDNDQQKTLRMAVIDMVIGFMAGVASISTGYFLRTAGFNWPFFTSAMLQLLNLVYVIFILEESKVVDKSQIVACCQALRRLAAGIYNLFAGRHSKRSWILVLMILILSTFSFSNTGGLSAITLYELNRPLCWSEILVGYGSAASTTVFITSFIGLYMFSRCLPNIPIIYIGMLSVVIGMTATAFAKTTLVMFLGKHIHTLKQRS